MIGEFKVGTIDLSSYNDVTGLKNTATVYWVDGIDRPLPLAQLVMAICFERAAKMEEEVVKLMNTLATTTKAIEDLAWFENVLVEFSDKGIYRAGVTPGDSNPIWGCDWGKILKSEKDLPEGCMWRGRNGDKLGRWTEWLIEKCGIKELPVGTTQENYSIDEVSKVLDSIETKLDSLNTTSQKDMIKLQSETTKRDQTYDLITAMVKSIGGVNSSISSSMR